MWRASSCFSNQASPTATRAAQASHGFRFSCYRWPHWGGSAGIGMAAFGVAQMNRSGRFTLATSTKQSSTSYRHCHDDFSNLQIQGTFLSAEVVKFSVLVGRAIQSDLIPRLTPHQGRNRPRRVDTAIQQRHHSHVDRHIHPKA